MFNFVGTKRFHICYLRFEVVKSPAIDKFHFHTSLISDTRIRDRSVSMIVENGSVW